MYPSPPPPSILATILADVLISFRQMYLCVCFVLRVRKQRRARFSNLSLSRDPETTTTTTIKLPFPRILRLFLTCRGVKKLFFPCTDFSRQQQQHTNHDAPHLFHVGLQFFSSHFEDLFSSMKRYFPRFYAHYFSRLTPIFTLAW